MEKYIGFKILFLLLFSCSTVLALQKQWATNMGHPEGNSVINNMAKLSNDEIVAVGYFEAPFVTIGSEILETTGTSPLVCILNNEGEFRKVLKFGGNNLDYAVDVATDKVDNIYVLGKSNSLLFFIGFDTLVNQGEGDAFVLKLDKDLNVIWTMSIATPFEDDVNAIKLDNEGNIYVTGMSIVFNSTSGIYKPYVTKYSPDKAILWTQQGHADYLVEILSLLLDNDNNCYWVGKSDELLFDDNFLFKSFDDRDNGFLIKYNSDGQRINSTQLPAIYGAYIEGQDIFVTHALYDTIDWNTYGLKTIKSNTDLEVIWENEIKCGYTHTAKIDKDKDGNLYIIATLSGDSVVFASDTFINHSNYWFYMYTNLSVFVFKYDMYNNEIWAKRFGEDYFNIGNSILVYGNNDLVISGAFQSDSIVFDNKVLYNNSETFRAYIIHNNYYEYKNNNAFISRIGNITTSINNNNYQQISLYPNPSQEDIRIQSTEFTDRPVQLKIYSTDGRLNQSSLQKPINNQLQLNISGLQAGMYFINIQQDDQFKTLRFLKN